MLVATDIAARGIDVEELGHVVNFDVPQAPEDYIHRVGRTGRAEAIGDAFTFVSPQEETDLRDIEKAIGRRLPRVTVPDFDYTANPDGQLEMPLAQRIAEIRAPASATSVHARRSTRRAAARPYTAARVVRSGRATSSTGPSRNPRGPHRSRRG